MWAKLDMPNLKTVQDIILLAHGDHLIDDDECLLLYDLINKSWLTISELWKIRLIFTQWGWL